MNIRNALKDTGKADGGSTRYAMWHDDVLCWFEKCGDRYVAPLSHSAILGDSYEPYLLQKEIIPTEAGELWEHNSELFFTFIDGGGRLRLQSTDATNYSMEYIDSYVSEKNWTRIHPPVEEEREKIVIEGVDWFKDEDGVVIPCQESDIFDWKSLLNKPPMNMTLTWDKEKP